MEPIAARLVRQHEQNKVTAHVLADHAQMVGRRIRAVDVVCSDGSSWVEDVVFPEPVTLRVLADQSDLDRWMDEDHCDPWYFVELLDAPPASQAILDQLDAHVVAVYGPAYHLDGTYEKPRWKVIA